MTIFRSKAIPILGAFLLMGCNQIMDSSNEAICATPSPANVTGSGAETPGEQAEVTKSCVHRWAYRLAGAKGPNSEIAKAVVGGCRDAIMKEGTLYLDASKDGMTITELDSLRADLDSEYLEMALFHVVQARAGHCQVP